MAVAASRYASDNYEIQEGIGGQQISIALGPQPFVRVRMVIRESRHIVEDKIYVLCDSHLGNSERRVQ